MATSLAPTEEVKNDEIISFTPELSVELSHGGLLRVIITNIDNYFKHIITNILFADYYASDYEDCLLVTFVFMFDTNDAVSWGKNIVKKNAITIEIGRIYDEYPIYFALPHFLCPYKFKFSISAYNISAEIWMEPSRECIVDIPAIWTFKDYRIGDMVEYVAESGLATIIDILPDNRYKILSKGKEIECDEAEILEQSVSIRSVINFIDQTEVIKMLFLRRNESAIYAVYEAIRNNISMHFVLKCLNMYSSVVDDHPLCNAKPICHYFAYHIISFLFEPHFNYSVHCLKGNDHPNLISQLKYQSLMKADKRTFWSCDLCRVQFVEWDFYFVDENIALNDAAQYCCSCVMQIIEASETLKKALIDVLANDLSMDCIDEIVHCLVGKVICTKLEHESAKNEHKRKIKDVTDFVPNAKKRKIKC